MISVSGVFRNVFTHAVPKPRSTGTGETRIAASSTPSTSAPTAPRGGQFQDPEEPGHVHVDVGGVGEDVHRPRFLVGSRTQLGVERRGRGRPVPAPPARSDQLQLVSLVVSSSGAAVPLLPSV